MKALVRQEFTLIHSFTRFVAENNFLCPSFSRLGPALKCIKCCLEVSCAVGGRLFARLWPRIISYVGIFVGWGAGFKICCLEFLERLRPFIHWVVAENNYSTSQVWLSCVSLN